MKAIKKFLSGLAIIGLIFSPTINVFADELVTNIVTPNDGGVYNIGDAIAFSALTTGGNSEYYSYVWNFGDGDSAFGQNYQKTYHGTGTFTVTLTSSDADNNQASDSIQITIQSPVTPLVASITSPSNNSQLVAGAPTSFSASATGGTGSYTYTWNFGDGDSAFGQNYQKTYTAAGNYHITLTVKDSNDVEAQASIDLVVTSASNSSITLTTPSAGTQWTADNTHSIAWTTSSDMPAGQSLTVELFTPGNTSANGFTTFSTPNDGGEVVNLTNVTPGSYFFRLSTVINGVTVYGGSGIFEVVPVNPGGGGSPAPTVDLKINGSDSSASITVGSTTTLTWTSTNASSCNASGAWSGPRSISGSETIGSGLATSTYTYTLTCINSQGSSADTVTLTVGGSSATLTISNIRVTDITPNSAIVRWTTNLAASSRVIYDTTSHPTLGGAPNYGYANSSDTLNTSPRVTEHAVTLNNLQPSTTYYFRVISEN